MSCRYSIGGLPVRQDGLNAAELHAIFLGCRINVIGESNSKFGRSFRRLKYYISNCLRLIRAEFSVASDDRNVFGAALKIRTRG